MRHKRINPNIPFEFVRQRRPGKCCRIQYHTNLIIYQKRLDRDTGAWKNGKRTMKNKTYLLIFGCLIFIVLAVALVSILDKTTPPSNSSDIRARAGTQNTLKLVGVVSSVDEGKGTIRVMGVQLAESSRSGDATNYGDWTVTVPPGFNMASLSPGTAVTIGVEPSTFNIATHAVAALTLTPGK